MHGDPPGPHPLADQVQLGLADRALQAQQQPVVVFGRVIDPVQIAQQRPGQGTQLKAADATPVPSGPAGTSRCPAPGPRGPGPPPRPAGRIRAGCRSRRPSAPDPRRSPAPATGPSPARPPAPPARTAAAWTRRARPPERRWTGAHRPPPADHGATARPCPWPVPTGASSLRSPSAPPPGPLVDRTIRSTSTLNIRPTSTRLTGGNDSHGGTLSGACRLWGATQLPRTPPTSRVHPGLGRTQPAHDRDHGQQTVNRYDGSILRRRLVYACSLARLLNAAGGI